MRILFIVHQFMPEFAAGTEQVALNLAKAAQRDGHHVEVLTRSVREDAAWSDSAGFRSASVDGIAVHALRGFNLTPLQEIGFQQDDLEVEVGRFLDLRPSFDLVHVLHPMRMLSALGVIRNLQIPYVLTLTDFYLPCWRTNLIRADGRLCAGPEGGAACIRHCSTLRMNDRDLLDRRDRMAEVLNGAAAVVACSDYVANIFRTEYPHMRIRVIPHGIDLLRFAPLPKAEPKSKIVFGYIGTLSEMKGVHVLVEAFARASPGRAELQLVGPSDDDFVKHLQEALPRHSAISIHPAIVARDVPAMLGSFDLLCLPSQVPETYSLAAHEGFAAGLPALVSDLGHPASVVKRYECGFAVAPRDTDAWARAITQIAENPSLLEEWKLRIPLPTRVEEEGFAYSQMYRALQFQH